MGRRIIAMIEIDEILYRWCKGLGKKKIAQSHGMSVNTVKSIVNQAIGLGLDRETTDAATLRIISQKLMDERQKPRPNPNSIQYRIKSHHEAIAKWLAEKDMTVTQMIRLLAERDELVSETSLRTYLSILKKRLRAATCSRHP